MKTVKNLVLVAVIAMLGIVGFVGCGGDDGGDPPNVPVTGVTLDKEEITLFEEGTDTLTATVEPSNASNKSVTWLSDNEDVATVSDTGVVTAVAKGTATITVTTADGSFTAECEVTVKPLPESISVTSQPTKTRYKLGETLNIDGLVVHIIYPEASGYEPEEIDGITIEHITGFDSTTAGEKTVTVAYGGHSDTFKVTVLPNYTVSFNSNGGSSVVSATVVEGDTVTEPIAPTKTATNAVYTFDGWYKETELTNIWDFATDTVTNDKTLYAKWIEKNIFELGDIGPGGGKVFYVSEEGFTMTDDNSTAHYLEAAPADMTSTLAWASEEFGNWADITGTGTEIGTGKKNTALILATDTEAPVAKACNEYTNNEKTDWFLPSKDELNQLYVNRESVGNLGTGWYWSSSQYNNSNAWNQRFSDGNQDYGGKIYTDAVRAVRAF